MDNVEEFYDEYTKKQSIKGINHRHLSIQRWLEEFGLKPTSKVLEVGCGIGTVSELILRYLNSNGSLLSTDISQKSLELSKSRLKKYKNVEIKAFDFTSDKIDGGRFDVIVLPDVIEHIPLENHAKLFLNLSSMLKEDGFIFIHIPEPNHLEWTTKHNPEELQIIDQPIHTQLLSKNIIDSNLYIQYLQSYCVYNQRPDYQAVVLKNIPLDDDYVPKKSFLHDSNSRRIYRKIKFYLRGGK